MISVGLEKLSRVGTMLEFREIRSRDGKSFLCLPSTFMYLDACLTYYVGELKD